MNPDSGWTMSTLNTHLTMVIAELREHTHERFLASEKAVKAALEASDKAVAIALAAQKEAAQKAERSAEARHADLVLRLNTTADTLNEKLTSLALRYEATAGTGRGMEKAWGLIVAALGVAVAVASVVTR